MNRETQPDIREGFGEFKYACVNLAGHVVQFIVEACTTEQALEIAETYCVKNDLTSESLQLIYEYFPPDN